MHNYEMVIGIEIHVVVNSDSKMFSPSKSSHNEIANTCINEIDLGLPGIMPQPNEVVVRKAIALAKALNMDIEKNLIFDRKNYFYQDLPKGYQITQQFHPIGKNGSIEININNKIKKIAIERIHIEEDTAKQIRKDGEILLDFNRAGMPLIEIVSKPVIKSSEEATLYLKKIKTILEYCNISDAKLEEGSLRADVNISINPIGSKLFGQRIEIKNINSISNVEKAIHFETNRQWKEIMKGKSLNIETRKFDDVTNTTVYMRDKTTDIDYRYMNEPNIFPIELNDDFIKSSISDYYVDINKIKNEIEQSLDDLNMSQHLFENFQIYKIFKKINDEVNNSKETYKWLVIEFMSFTSKDNISPEKINDFFLDEIIDLIKQILLNNINQKQAKELIKLLYLNKNKTIKLLIKENNFKQINNEDILEKILKDIIKKNPKMLLDIQDRPERVEKFFIGMIMKETNGQANPNSALKVFKKILKVS